MHGRFLSRKRPSPFSALVELRVEVFRRSGAGSTVTAGMDNLDAKQLATLKLCASLLAVLVMVLGTRSAILAARADEGTDATALIWVGLLIVALIWLLTAVQARFSRR